MSEKVRVGQVWQDLDPRCPHRQLRVIAVEGERAQVQHVRGGRKTWVSIRRMLPTSTRGYRLVRTSSDETGEQT